MAKEIELSERLNSEYKAKAEEITAPTRDNKPGVRLDERTQLSPMEETMFQSFYKDYALREGMNPNPDAPEQQYDYRGAYKAGVNPPKSSEGEHWPSKHKMSNHPNRYPNKAENFKTKKKMEFDSKYDKWQDK